MTASELERRIRAVLRGVDCRVAADVLHELARQQYLRYAAEAAHAQYKHGVTDAKAGAIEPFDPA